MKKATGLTLLLLALLTLSCGNRKHDAAYYEQMVDSIRRATAGADIERLGEFAAVPVPANENFGYPADAHLKAMALPSMHRRQVILLCEMQDSITPALYLYTMDKKHHPIDMLNIYHQETVNRKTDKGMDKGMTYNEYYITSHYEITVMRYFKGHEDGKQQLEEARRYTISKDGMFEEQPIEL